MENAIALVEGHGQVVLSTKTGKTGSFARAIAFASRDTRMAMGQALYAKWLANGQYRPLVEDILNCGLVAKAAVPYLQVALPPAGPVSKEMLMTLCQQVAHAVNSKGKEIKGQKAFVFGIVERIANQAADAEQSVWNTLGA
jgi:hypothetical protein